MVENKIDQNSKSITLLTIAVSSMATLFIALLIYIKKMHGKSIQIATKFVEVTGAMNATTEKLAESIRVSGDKISAAVDRQERTVDDLHKFILSTLK